MRFRLNVNCFANFVLSEPRHCFYKRNLNFNQFGVIIWMRFGCVLGNFVSYCEHNLKIKSGSNFHGHGGGGGLRSEGVF